jgi:hypothetical protein
MSEDERSVCVAIPQPMTIKKLNLNRLKNADWKKFEPENRVFFEKMGRARKADFRGMRNPEENGVGAGSNNSKTPGKRRFSRDEKRTSIPDIGRFCLAWQILRKEANFPEK